MTKIPKTTALEMDCTRCKMPAGTLCDNAGQRYCQSRINAAMEVTRNRNREAKQR